MSSPPIWRGCLYEGMRYLTGGYSGLSPPVPALRVHLPGGNRFSTFPCRGKDLALQGRSDLQDYCGTGMNYTIICSPIVPGRYGERNHHCRTVLVRHCCASMVRKPIFVTGDLSLSCPEQRGMKKPGTESGRTEQESGEPAFERK